MVSRPTVGEMCAIHTHPRGKQNIRPFPEASLAPVPSLNKKYGCISMRFNFQPPTQESKEAFNAATKQKKTG